ncbi:unnamed protein product [Caenorhabditis brenneri]
MGTRRIRRDDGEYTLFFRKVSPFSNHHPAEFDCDESINFKETKRFSCTEQYYMYNKASLLKDCPLMEEVLNCDNPREMKTMCSIKNLRNWCEYTWNRCKQDVMYTGCTAKFRASKHLRYVLFLSTGSKLVECSPFDRVWGIGKDLEKALTSSLNSGENLLGKILDRIREELWTDRDYRDEREEVENRMRKDKDYLLNAMEQIDLMYKGRATQRYLLSQGHIYRDDQSYVSSDVLSLIPEWAIPPRLRRDEPIAASPPQIHNFQHAPAFEGSIISLRDRREEGAGVEVVLHESGAEVGEEIGAEADLGMTEGEAEAVPDIQEIDPLLQCSLDNESPKFLKEVHREGEGAEAKAEKIEEDVAVEVAIEIEDLGDPEAGVVIVGREKEAEAEIIIGKESVSVPILYVHHDRNPKKNVIRD